MAPCQRAARCFCRKEKLKQVNATLLFYSFSSFCDIYMHTYTFFCFFIYLGVYSLYNILICFVFSILSYFLPSYLSFFLSFFFSFEFGRLDFDAQYEI